MIPRISEQWESRSTAQMGLWPWHKVVLAIVIVALVVGILVVYDQYTVWGWQTGTPREQPPVTPTPVSTQMSWYEIYLQKAEWYQRNADWDLHVADEALGLADRDLEKGDMTSYNNNIRKYERFMESYACNQKLADEYFLKAQSELAAES